MAVALTLGVAFAVAADPEIQPDSVQHRITGLFSTDRENDLRTAVKKLPGITLLSIDFARGEATFAYDRAKVFGNGKPEQIIERFDNLLRSASSNTFGVKPLCATPKEKLTLVEIAVAGLDCKACALGAYEVISGIDGVAHATVSFKEGRLTALIDPDKTNRAALEDALKKHEVDVLAK